METTFKSRQTEKYKQVVVSHDMTKLERDQCKQLVAEAKECEANDDSGQYTYRVRGAPGDMRRI